MTQKYKLRRPEAYVQANKSRGSDIPKSKYNGKFSFEVQRLTCETVSKTRMAFSNMFWTIPESFQLDFQPSHVILKNNRRKQTKIMKKRYPVIKSLTPMPFGMPICFFT